MHDSSKQNFIERFTSIGPDEFYIFLVKYADSRISDNTINSGTSPEVELLNYSNQFSQIYKREKKDIHKLISFSFKRAANKTYRTLYKKKLIKKSSKFLNLVE